MLKHAAFFVAGAVAVVAALLVSSLLVAHRAANAKVEVSGPISTTVTIHVAQNPQALLPVSDAQALLNRITGMTDSDKKKISDALVSGLVTELRVESHVAGETHWIEVRPNAANFAIQGSSEVHFGPTELHIEKVETPKPSATNSKPPASMP